MGDRFIVEVRGRLVCKLCNVALLEYNIQDHIDGAKHQSRLPRRRAPHRPQTPPPPPPPVHRSQQRLRKHIKAARDGSYVCTLCDIDRMTLGNIDSHVDGSRHQGNLQAVRGPPATSRAVYHYTVADIHIESDPYGYYVCTLCQTGRMTWDNAQNHLRGNQHQQNMCYQPQPVYIPPRSRRKRHGGKGRKPDSKVMSQFKSQIDQSRPYDVYELPASYATQAISEFPTPGEVYKAKMALVRTATAKAQEFAGGPFFQKDGNFITNLLDKQGRSLPELRKFLHVQLYLEEANSVIELAAYNKKLEYQQLQRDDNSQLYKVMLPGVAENRPSVLRGDRLVIRQVGSDEDATFEAFVHHVNVDNILFSLPDSFSKVYSDRFEMIFCLARTQERKLHRCSDICPDAALLFRESTVGADTFQPFAVNPSIATCGTVLALNDLQRKFVEHVRGKTRLSALWGPPGTGKTTTLVAAIIDTVLRVPSAKILVCTPSNEAADLIVERIKSSGDMSGKFHPDFVMRLHSLTRSVKAVPEDVRKVSPRGEHGSFSFPQLSEITGCRIVVSTLMTADRFYSVGLRQDHFTHLFVDEAGHATEQLLMIALNVTGGSPDGTCNTKVVLAGDPKQLGPRATIPKLLEYNLYQSPLQRIQENEDMWKTVGSQLLLCYRSHPAIVHLVNACYENKLQPYVPDVNTFAPLWKSATVQRYWQSHLTNTNMQQGALADAPRQPILCLTHTEPESREEDSPSWKNEFEVKKIVEIVIELKESKLANFSDIAIITPYRKQAQRILDTLYWGLKDKYPEMSDANGQPLPRDRMPIKVATVDSFQGRESRVVIVSCVRSAKEHASHDAKFGIGFLQQPERTNVALSRAKDLLVIIGNKNVLCTDKSWQDYFRRLEEMDATNSGVMINLGGPRLGNNAINASDDAGDDGVEERGGVNREE